MRLHHHHPLHYFEWIKIQGALLRHQGVPAYDVLESIEALHASDNGRSVEEVLPKAAEKDQSIARCLHQIYRKNI